MIEILKFNSVKKEEIFARVAEKVDVSGVVSEIIDNVVYDGLNLQLERITKKNRGDVIE